jgi:hypothetical protein
MQVIFVCPIQNLLIIMFGTGMMYKFSITVDTWHSKPWDHVYSHGAEYV